jgi:methylthioribose-1-phosphate isomerase
MLINNRPSRTIREHADGGVRVLDQRVLPHRIEEFVIDGLEAATFAIRQMVVRGAPLIGATAAYGVAVTLRGGKPGRELLETAVNQLAATRPTAVNLRWALQRVSNRLLATPETAEWVEAAFAEARVICEEDVVCNEAIGRTGLQILSQLWERRKAAGARRLEILTHCNAGWLACVDWGTATAPIYQAARAGIPVHVWVDETRPRNQGAALTAWELGQNGVPHTLIVDNAGGHLMQRGQVDVCIVGTDRVGARGDVANKIGTYLKALAAQDAGVPFYVAAPTSSIDWSVEDGLSQIPIEERSGREVTHVWGVDDAGVAREVRICAPDTAAANPAFDVTPGRLVTALLTEAGVVAADAASLARLRAGECER